jgi:hypothetical protein
MEFYTRENEPILTPDLVEERLLMAFHLDRSPNTSAVAWWLEDRDVSREFTESEGTFFNEIISDVMPEFFRECVRIYPSIFKELCGAYEALLAREAPKNETLLADEAMTWIVEPEPDEQVDDDRLKVLDWLRSGKSGRAWSEAKGKSPTDLNRSRARYFAALAGRLTNAPQPVIRAVYVNEDIAVGLDAISAAIRRSPRKTLRLIEGGALPAGKIAGHYCASRDMLKARQPVGALAA